MAGDILVLFEDVNLCIYKNDPQWHYFVRNTEDYVYFRNDNIAWCDLAILDSKEIVDYCLKGIKEQMENGDFRFISSLMRLTAFRETLC